MASSSISAEATPPWLELPREITATILHKLGAIEILTAAQRACTTWRSVCQDVSMWRCIDMRNSDLWETPYDLEKMCCHAVDRSQGQLIDINIEYFGTDDLLLYISQRSCQLRRLRLVFSYGITGKGVTEAAKQFPLLEELHLYYVSFGAEAIEAVGSSCPQLKSFIFNKRGYKCQHAACDMEALAVAKNMQELRHLQLLGNKLTNEGLQAILDGCPHLESLDLRQCFNVRLGGNLGRLCSERIKDLRRPHDSTDDYGFDAEFPDSDTSDEDYITGFSDNDVGYDYNAATLKTVATLGAIYNDSNEYYAPDIPADYDIVAHLSSWRGIIRSTLRDVGYEHLLKGPPIGEDDFSFMPPANRTSIHNEYDNVYSSLYGVQNCTHVYMRSGSHNTNVSKSSEFGGERSPPTYTTDIVPIHMGGLDDDVYVPGTDVDM